MSATSCSASDVQIRDCHRLKGFANASSRCFDADCFTRTKKTDILSHTIHQTSELPVKRAGRYRLTAAFLSSLDLDATTVSMTA